jgi:palmitoyl-protein thioesterase
MMLHLLLSVGLAAAWVDGLQWPIVIMHGMGDFADNPLGMVPIRQQLSKHAGTYVTNIALGDGSVQDQSSEFLMLMDDEVDTFAKKVRADPKLSNGFDAIGFSQGNLIIRGYVQRYNAPPVNRFLSMHGPMVGVAGFPRCDYGLEICRLFDRLLGILAYTDIAQGSLAQANYLRDPLRIPEYVKKCKFLPDINNEGPAKNQTYKDNFVKLEKLVLVKALQDTMIQPRDSEWFGFFADNSQSTLLPMNETMWYLEDSFGLQTLHKAGRVYFETTPGNHLQFGVKDLEHLVDTYFV